MPFPFTLPTTSAIAFSQHYTSQTYPSLPLACSTHRGILRDALKTHKRLSPASQGANIKHIVSVTTEYLSYLLFLEEATKTGAAIPKPGAPAITTEWRPVVSSTSRFGVRQPSRRREKGLQYEIHWVLSTLAYANTIQARTLLMEFLSPSISSADSSSSPLLPQAIKHLLTAASIFNYLLTLPMPIEGEKSSVPVDISQPMLSSLASISLASATLLAVLKSDPYPTYLALTTATNTGGKTADSKEYLYNSPPLPTGVKALLFSRLCIAASEHAAKAQGAISSLIKEGAVSEDYTRYLEDLRRAARARGCRFLGVDAEAQGRLGEGIGWIKLGREILTGSAPSPNDEPSPDTNKDKKSLASRIEKLRLSSSSSPSPSLANSSLFSNSAGGLPPHLDPCSIHSELRTIQALEARWSKTNDYLMFERVPSTNSLVGKTPSGRDVHIVPEFTPPRLGDDQIAELRKGGKETGGDANEAADREYASRGEEYWEQSRPDGNRMDSSDEEELVQRQSSGYPGGFY